MDAACVPAGFCLTPLSVGGCFRFEMTPLYLLFATGFRLLLRACLRFLHPFLGGRRGDFGLLDDRHDVTRPQFRREFRRNGGHRRRRFDLRFRWSVDDMHDGSVDARLVFHPAQEIQDHVGALRVTFDSQHNGNRCHGVYRRIVMPGVTALEGLVGHERFLPAEAIAAIFFFPYFFRPTAAATAAGSRAPLAAALFSTALKRAPLPSLALIIEPFSTPAWRACRTSCWRNTP